MELASGLLLLLLSVAPLLCRANVDCSGVDGFLETPEETSSYVTHVFTPDGTGTGCDTVTQNCFATVNDNLHQRTWYIGNTKSPAGIFYKNNMIQTWNIQCPPLTVLHLFPQFLDTEADSNGACEMFDGVRVEAGDFTEVFCGGEAARTSSMLHNDGLGMIFTGGNATIQFCSNGNDAQNQGFVVRAMCIDPSFTLHPNCVDFTDVRGTRKGSDFIDRIFEPFATPMRTNILHKRSADLSDLPRKEAHILELLTSGKLNRQKRFVNEQLIQFDLEESHIVTYMDDILKIDFSNGTMATFTVKWLVTTSELLTTRIFDGRLPTALRTLQGPGKVEIFGDMAIVEYTVSEDMIPNLLIQTIQELDAINRIANYTFFNYINPYPVICADGPANPLAVPLPAATEDDSRYLNVRNLGFIQEEIINGTCERRVRIDVAPGIDSRVEANILDFCRFFYYSCNAMLRGFCAETLNLDRMSG